MSRRKKRPIDQERLRHPGVRTKIYVQADMIGAGKIELLRTLKRAGSISAAAREMGMGYRRAWFLLDTIQRCFREPLFETTRGGADPGGSILTPLGEELIARYDAHIEKIEKASADFLGWLETHQSDRPAGDGDS
ncbi:LysR family transcriptional regulator [Halovulum dunhuangense]|uniref:LysR family transcriptional regulator n=2 Tax=Halovulum dunhuangense TaxID=1505036 RepID=A0A849L5Z0_9RHOB|nr:LysR family transcriptional regulator [Halovulum dunhuangense]